MRYLVAIPASTYLVHHPDFWKVSILWFFTAVGREGGGGKSSSGNNLAAEEGAPWWRVSLCIVVGEKGLLFILLTAWLPSPPPFPPLRRFCCDYEMSPWTAIFIFQLRLLPRSRRDLREKTWRCWVSDEDKTQTRGFSYPGEGETVGTRTIPIS